MISLGEKLDGKYIVRSRLGAGGFGEVFLAEDEAIPGRQLAIKVLSAYSEGKHDDLIWEMRALSKFNFAGVVSFLHHFSHGDVIVLVMEFCAGGSLQHRLDTGGAIPLNEAFRWGASLCDTLAHVHERGIVHHDIKPANILFSLDGAIKLSDFGVANRHAGTRLYMPPEMLIGEFPSRTDPRVDIYALGVTLLEMLAGDHPFEAMSPDVALESRIAHDFIPGTLPRWAQEVLLRATHPTPELRFQTMRDFGEAIEGKHVPYIFDGNRIKAHTLAEKSELQLSKQKWKAAEKLAMQALHLSPDCAPALVAAGRSHLLIRRIDKAKAFFSRALSVNPRIHVQKELGWINLEEGNLPTAISLLCDHLDRNAADFEAYNLLLKCFFLSERYEAGEDLARDVMNEKGFNECFRNNRFLCRLLNGGYSDSYLSGIDPDEVGNPFITHNLSVALEQPSSWAAGDKQALCQKLLFQEYRFGQALSAGKRNEISIALADGTSKVTAEPIVSIGSLPANDVVLRNVTVSRRHAVIVNFPNEVWLYDLNSTRGSLLDESAVSGRVLLDGLHAFRAGDVFMKIGARANLLV